MQCVNLFDVSKPSPAAKSVAARRDIDLFQNPPTDLLQFRSAGCLTAECDATAHLTPVVHGSKSITSSATTTRASTTTKRGKYDRSEGRGKRTTWKHRVCEHLRTLLNGSVLTTGECRHDCPKDRKCASSLSLACLHRASVHSFGDGVVPAL